MTEIPLKHMHEHAVNHVLFYMDNPKFTIEERVAYFFYLKTAIEMFMESIDEAAAGAGE